MWATEKINFLQLFYSKSDGELSTIANDNLLGDKLSQTSGWQNLQKHLLKLSIVIL